MRKHYPQSKQAQPVSEEPLMKRGGLKPVVDDPRSSSSVREMVIDAYATTVTPGEIAYWQNKQAAQEA
jgi:hypothetical protein